MPHAAQIFLRCKLLITLERKGQVCPKLIISQHIRIIRRLQRAVAVLAEDFVQNTSGCLLRALRELKRVDEILQVLNRLLIVFCW